MQNEGKASVITIDSLMNAPMEMPNEQQSTVDALKEAMSPAQDVLPGLEPLGDIIPDPVVVDATPSATTPDPLIPDPINDLPPANEIKESEYSKMYKTALKEVFGNDLGVFVQEVDGEDKEFTLEDIEVDAETFADILKSKIEDIKESATRNKISVEGISDFTQRIIEVERNGGEISGLLQMKQQLSDPLDGLDLDNPEDQKEIIFLRGAASGQNEADLRRLIKMYDMEGILEEEAQKAYTTLRTAIDAKLNEAVMQSELAKKQREEEFKVFKKQVKENLGQFQLNDKIKSKLVDLATKVDENGQLELDIRYKEFSRNPEKAARIALMLFDEEEFIKQVTNKEVTAKQLDSARKLKIIPRSSSTIVEPNKTKASERTVNLSDLI